jgi:outer membrane receptor protein involved in Fe transport
MMRWLVAPFVLILAAGPAAAAAGPDTLEVELPGIVVEALRGRDRLADVPAAAFVLGREGLRRTGPARLTSVLAALPGFHGYRRNSTGDAAVVDPRGFTASGESSYLKLLVNGQDVRDVENGNVDWDWVAPGDVERVEVVQGPGAWLYGDAAEGGIVNVVGRAPAPGFGSSCAVRGGSFGQRTAGLSLRAGRDRDAAELGGTWRGVDGWRRRSRERVAGGSAALRRSSGGWTMSLDGRWLDADRQDPGTLDATRLAADREQAETAWDFTHSRRLIVSGRIARGDGGGGWSVTPYARGEDNRRVQTLFFTPMLHDARATTGGVEAAWRGPATVGGRGVALMAGAQAEHSALRSTYDDFAPGSGAGARAGEGRSRRTLFAGYAGARLEIDRATSLRVHVRGDAARVGAEDELAGTETPARTMSALSPVVALQRRVGGSGTAYASFTTAFRVPTLQQLFDRRPFQSQFGPLTLSNQDLNPQRSVSVEVGGRVDGAGGGFASAALYSIRVRDEIDFDLATFRYSNISRSWHRGAQVAARQPLARGTYVAGSATWQPTTFSGGGSDGRQINGVPESLGSLALGWTGGGAGVELAAGFVGRQYLDKLERHPLAGATTLDLTVSGGVARLHGLVRVTNLLDRRYSDSGFIGFDEFFQEEERFSPAAPRGIQVAVRFDG